MMIRERRAPAPPPVFLEILTALAYRSGRRIRSGQRTGQTRKRDFDMARKWALKQIGVDRNRLRGPFNRVNPR